MSLESPREWTWNVVYTPGTVRLLLPFLQSLVDWSEHCQFRLISNGCHGDEIALLHKMASRSDRLSVEVYAETCQVHGVVLSDLQQRETGRWFAMMDSDIFATGPYEETFRAALENHQATFTCSPIWCGAGQEIFPNDFRGMFGVFGKLWDERICGLTYCAVYDNAAVNHCRQKHDVDFRLRLWPKLPKSLQHLFREEDLETYYYDTAKVLNLLLSLDGYSLNLQTTPSLIHLGGISCIKNDPLQHDHRGTRYIRQLYAQLPRFVRQAGAAVGLYRGWRSAALSRELVYDEVRRNRRTTSCHHVSRALQEILKTGRSSRDFAHPDRELAATVNWVVRQLETLIGENPSGTVDVEDGAYCLKFPDSLTPSLAGRKAA